MGKRASYREDTGHFKFTNVNPKNLISAGDCVVRALSIANVDSWERVYSELCSIGKKECRMPNDNAVYEKYLEHNGWEMYAQARKKDNTKYTAKEFAELSGKKKITIVIRLANHISVVRNGYILDTWDCGDKTVGNYWMHK